MCALFTSTIYVRYVCSHLQFISQRLRERKRNTYVVQHQIQIRNTFNTNGIIDYIVFCKVLVLFRTCFTGKQCSKISVRVAYMSEMINGITYGIVLR